MSKYDQLTELLLHLGDSAIVQAQRLCELCGHAPALEEEVALMNVGLDLVGQARNWLEYAAERIDDGRDADALVYRRDELAYRNLLLVEQPNGDFAVTMCKQFLYDAWHYEILNSLIHSSDERVAGIAAKSLKEVTYHLKRSADWVVRMGDGTDESHQRMVKAVDHLWRYVFELAQLDETKQSVIEQGILPGGEDLPERWLAMVTQVFERATLGVPAPAPSIYLNGQKGLHSECLGILLAEMQFLQRAYPDASW